MSRPIQLYQDEYGLAIARELQRNQERSRRGKTPLHPSLDQAEARAATDAQNKANAAQNNANNYAWTQDNSVLSQAAANDNSVLAQANNYSASLHNQQQPYLVPVGAEILWLPASPIPGGWVDTGRTCALDAGNTRKVLRKA